MSFYDINYSQLINQLLPVRLRTAIQKGWLRSLIAPIIWLQSQFVAARSNDLYTIAHNSQVVYLEAALNDLFDPISRNIYVADGLFRDPIFIYQPLELKPAWLSLASEIGSTIYLSPVSLFTNAETTLLGNSFIVKVPSTLTFDTQRMKAILEKYRLAGRSIYSIELY